MSAAASNVLELLQTIARHLGASYLTISASGLANLQFATEAELEDACARFGVRARRVDFDGTTWLAGRVDFPEGSISFNGPHRSNAQPDEQMAAGHA